MLDKTSSTMDEARLLLEDWLYEETKGSVQWGPFKGMWLPREEAWDAHALAPKLLGCYEQELHDVLEEEISRLARLPQPKIVNVGCAEGYYAIGMAGRLRNAKVWACDKDNDSRAIAEHAAKVNGVDVEFGTAVSDMFEAPDLIIMDCEGAEVDYLNPVEFPGLKRAHIVVELHPFPHLNLAEVLTERFESIHTCYLIREGARDPNIFKVLQDRHSDVRWAAVNENRPVTMYWAVMRPRG